jgi:hypothetical protein
MQQQFANDGSDGRSADLHAEQHRTDRGELDQLLGDQRSDGERSHGLLCSRRHLRYGHGDVGNDSRHLQWDPDGNAQYGLRRIDRSQSGGESGGHTASAGLQ